MPSTPDLTTASQTEQFPVRNRFTNAINFTAEIVCRPDASISIKLGLAVRWAVKNSADLSYADLSYANLRYANLSSADLSSADLRSADLSSADLRYANLRSADLSSADLRYANLSSANLSSADLSSADLRYANLRSADLSSADLRYANLSSADLRSADLSSADLRSADLSSADLRSADLSSADLSSADLRSADLSYANLSSADLSSADLSYADLRSFKNDFWAVLTTARKEVPGLVKAMREGRIDGSTYRGACACLVGTIANVRHVNVYTLETDSSRPAEQWFLMIKKGDKPGDDSGGGFALTQALEWAEEYCALSGVKLPKAKAVKAALVEAVQ